MARLAVLLIVAALAGGGIVTAAGASGPTAVAAKTPKLTKAQKKSKKKCEKRSYRHRYELVKIVKKKGKKVGAYRCHKLSDDELYAEQEADLANNPSAGEDDGEGGQPPIKL